MRVLVISDLHGNWAALQAVLAATQYDQVLCLGDLVNYGPQPKECLDWARNNCSISIRGNHDHAVGTRADCGCAPAFRPLADETRELTWRLLKPADIEFLAARPVQASTAIDG